MREKHSLLERRDESESRLYGKAFVITATLLVCQVIVLLYVSKSLTLLGDSIHGGSDLSVNAGSFIVALLVSTNRLARWENQIRKTFAYIGIALLVVGAFYVLIEAHERLNSPIYNLSLWVPVVATLGGAGNFWVHKMLSRVPQEEHNHTHTVFSYHVFSDFILSVTVVISWLITFTFGWIEADPVLSMGVAGYMFFLAGILFNKVCLKTTHNSRQ